VNASQKLWRPAHHRPYRITGVRQINRVRRENLVRAPCRKVIALPAVSLSLVPKWHVTIIWSALLRPSGWWPAGFGSLLRRHNARWGTRPRGGPRVAQRATRVATLLSSQGAAPNVRDSPPRHRLPTRCPWSAHPSAVHIFEAAARHAAHQLRST